MIWTDKFANIAWTSISSELSSPGVANFGLRAKVEASREQFGQAAADFLQQDFYVDDGLKSFPTPKDTIQYNLLINSPTGVFQNQFTYNNGKK